MNGYDILQNAGIYKDVANIVVDYLQDDVKACKDLHKDRLNNVHSQLFQYYDDYKCTESLSSFYENCVFNALERNTKYIQSYHYFSDDEFDSYIKQELITINEVINGNVYIELRFDRLQKRLEQFERAFPEIFEHDTFTSKEITHLKKLFRCKLPTVEGDSINDTYYCYYCDSHTRCYECDERNGYGRMITLKPYDLAFFIHRLRNRNITHRLYHNSHINGRKIFDTLEDFPDTDTQNIKDLYHNDLYNYFKDLETKKRIEKRREDLKLCTTFQDGWEHTYDILCGPRNNEFRRQMENVTVRVVKRTAKMLQFTVGNRGTVYRKKIQVDKLLNNETEGEYVMWFRERISTFDVITRNLHRKAK